METVVIIGPSTFDLIFFVIVLLFGLDFIYSGILAVKDPRKYLQKPKLFGLWAIKRMNTLTRVPKASKLTLFLYSIKNMAFQALVAGVMLMVIGVLAILDALNTLP